MSIMDLKKNAPKGEFLAYINKEEAAMLKKAGGSGKLVNGIPSFRPQDYGQEARAKGTHGFDKKDFDQSDTSNPYSNASQQANKDLNDRVAANQAQRQRNAEIKQDIKKRELEKSKYDVGPKKKFNVFDYGKNYIKNRQKGLYNSFPNNPKRELEYLSSLQITNPEKYNTLPQNLKDLLENTQYDMSGTFKDQPKFSYDDFESLTQFDDGAFVQYAKDRGSPGLSVAGDMSQVGIKSIRKDQFGKPVKDIFGNTLFDYGKDPRGGDGDGRQQFIPINYNTGAGTTEVVEPYTNDFAYRFGDNQDVIYENYGTPGYRNTRADGGIMGTRARRAFGGIMDRVTGRKAYGLGSIFKSVGKAVKGVAKAAGKVLKSDVGKMALLAAGAYYTGGALGGTGGFSNAFTSTGNFGVLGSKAMQGAKFLGKKALFTDGALDFGKAAIFGTSMLPLLGIGTKAKPNEDIGMTARGGRLIDPLTGEPNDMAGMRENIELAKLEAGDDADKLAAIDAKYNNMLNLQYQAGLPDATPYNLYGSKGYRTTVATGGRIGKAEGGLMDLGGMEKDYRAEGGFVPIGEYEKKDDVPARLSVNEFVFTADAVRNAGQGDIDKGAEVMENMMKNLENGGRVSEESQGNTGAQNMFSVSERIGEVI